MVPKDCDIDLEAIMGNPLARTIAARCFVMKAGLENTEWHLIEPCMPAPRPCGWQRCWPMQEITKTIFYWLRAGWPRRLSVIGYD